MRSFFFLLIFLLLLPLVGYAQSSTEKTPQIWILEIKGNHTFSDLVIKEHVATEAFSLWERVQFWDQKGHPLNKLRIKKDVIRIQNFYKKRGFPSVQVDYKIIQLQEHKRKLLFMVEEGEPILIKNVTFTFTPAEYKSYINKNERFVTKRQKGSYREGNRYIAAKKIQVANSYRRLLKKIGFAYAQVQIKSKVDSTAHRATLMIHINSGPLSYISQIKIKGAETLSKNYLIRESGLKLGDRYNLDEIQKAQRKLFDEPLVNFVAVYIPDQPHDSTLTLALRVQEKEVRTLQLSVGFSTEEYLRGKVSWIHRNAFGQAHRFSVTAKASFIEQFLGLNYLFPYVFNSNSSFLLAPFARHLLRPGYELYQWGITHSLIYRYNRDLTSSLSYRFTQNEEVSRDMDINLPDTTKMYDLSSIQLSALYSKGLRLIDRGWVVQPAAQVSGLLGTSDYQFQKLSIDLRRYIKITESTTLALRVQAAKIFAVQEDSLPRSVRLYLGGSNSVRGWGHQELGPKIAVYRNDQGDRVSSLQPDAQFDYFIPVGGRTALAFNVEVRQDIYSLLRGFSFVLFLDGGQVWRREVNIANRPFQFGIGGGLRYRSPIGPLRLDVAYKLNPSDGDLEMLNGHQYGNVWNRFAVYVSIGQAF